MSWENIIKNVEMENTESYQRKLRTLKYDERGNPISKLLGMLGHEATGELTYEETEIIMDIERLRVKMIENFQDRIKNAER